MATSRSWCNAALREWVFTFVAHNAHNHVSSCIERQKMSRIMGDAKEIHFDVSCGSAFLDRTNETSSYPRKSCPRSKNCGMNRNWFLLPTMLTIMSVVVTSPKNWAASRERQKNSSLMTKVLPKSRHQETRKSCSRSKTWGSWKRFTWIGIQICCPQCLQWCQLLYWDPQKRAAWHGEKKRTTSIWPPIYRWKKKTYEISLTKQKLGANEKGLHE